MKTKLLSVLATVILFFTSNVILGQSPPSLGSAYSFALFTAAGAFTNDGASTFVTGDVGTNVGAFSAFPPGILVGEIHVADPASAQAATDVDLAYGTMSTITCGSVIGTTMGGGQMLLPNVYCLGAASTINGDLILDGQGDPTSLFIFKIDGALATTVDSRVILTNSASICNVYWQVNGQVDLGNNSLFQGTLLVNGAINLLEAATLYGRALSRAGAISLHNNLVTLVLEPTAPAITADGATTFCEGDSIVLSGNIDGTWSEGSTSPSITVSTSGDYFVTNTNGCGSDTSNHIIVTVTPCAVPCPAPVITSIDSVCGNNASVCWTFVPGATEYIIQWNILPDTTWIYTTVIGPDTCYQFMNNFGDVNQIQVAAVCESGDTSDYSPLVTWTNYLVCAAPDGLVASNITSTSATLSWNANPNANKYKVFYKYGVNKTIINQNGTTLAITGLPPSTKIKWKVKSRCNSCGIQSWGSYSPVKSFTTAALKQVNSGLVSEGSLNIFPNPANLNFTVSFKAGYSSQQSYTLTLQDLLGHVLMTEAGALTDGLLSKDVALPNGISSGIYFLVITTDGQQFRERLVVNR